MSYLPTPAPAAYISWFTALSAWRITAAILKPTSQLHAQSRRHGTANIPRCSACTSWHLLPTAKTRAGCRKKYGAVIGWYQTSARESQNEQLDKMFRISKGANQMSEELYYHFVSANKRLRKGSEHDNIE